MNVLLIGSGGREHAIAEAVQASPMIGNLYVSPGNSGTEKHNVDLDITNHDAVCSWCDEQAIDLVVVGPEQPLIAGLADALADAGVACFGPSHAAARLEGSKAFAREFAERFNIPSLRYALFANSADAIDWIDEVDFDVVVKADGVAGGKGVVVPESRAEAVDAVRAMLDEGLHGESSSQIVLEERVYGEEISLFGISDGHTVSVIGSAQDHKRLGEGDTGPNTGGMGAFSPVPGIDAAREQQLASQFLEPVTRGMAEMGTPYVGVIFAGIMLTSDGPRLIEYNCRFGDPEAQTLLVRLDGDLLDTMQAAVTGQLDATAMGHRQRTAATVVVCADGYPATPRRGVAVPDVAERQDLHLFYAATTRDASGKVVSTGGRVLAVTATGSTLDLALSLAYSAVDELVGDGLFARSDIGWRHATSSHAKPVTPRREGTS